MGACSSPTLRQRRHCQQIQKSPSRREYPKNGFRNADSVCKGSEVRTANISSNDGLQENPMSSAMTALGEILFFDKRGSSGGEWQVLGLGCMISTRILLASDHYLHLYSPQQLAFRSLKGKSIVRVMQCLYPPASMLPKEKKKSTYLHKRVSPGLFLMDEAFPCEDFMELGTSVLTEQMENSEFQSMQFKEKIIEQTSRNLYFYTTKSAPERGWPLLYQLYGTFYCVGLYSFPQVSDSMLWSDNLVQRFKNCEGKLCGAEYINSVEISEALIQMKAVPCQGDKFQDLLMQLQQSSDKSDQEKAEVIFRLGIYYGSLGNYIKQKQHYLIALDLYLNCCHPQPIDSIAALYHNLGVCLSEIGDNLQARHYLQKSLKLKLEEEDQRYGENVADTYNQLGVVYKKERRSQQALIYYTKAYNIYSQLNYFEKMSMVFNNITLLSQDSQAHSSNEAKYLGVLVILNKTKGENCIQMAEVLFNLAKMQSQCKNYGTAISYLSKAVNVMKNLRLQQHSHYKMMVQVIEEVDSKVKQQNEKREWLLKSTALMQML